MATFEAPFDRQIGSRYHFILLLRQLLHVSCFETCKSCLNISKYREAKQKRFFLNVILGSKCSSQKVVNKIRYIIKSNGKMSCPVYIQVNIYCARADSAVRIF